jgi:hypothetical protein
MTSILNFIKIYQLIQKLLGVAGDTDRQTGDPIILTFLFKESRLKTRHRGVKNLHTGASPKLSIAEKMVSKKSVLE